jgi:penicillin-binding protein 1A
MRRFLILGLSVMLSLAMVGAVAAGIGYVYFSRNLPDHEALKQYTPKITTRLYAADGQMITEYAEQRRVFVPYGMMPPLVIQAFLASEDAAFFHHKGVSFRGVMRAAFLNAWSWVNDTGRRQGASTITQQVAKNFLVGNEKSLERKVKEAIVAFRIERALSKETILELYLNEIYFGLGSYGIGSAAQRYFGKALTELTPDEAAFLAALPKAPSNYHPVKNHDAALARRNWVLFRMGEIGVLKPDEVIFYQKKPLLPPKEVTLSYVNAPYFAEDIRRDLVDRYGSQVLYTGGLSVRTTLNPMMQDEAHKALMRGAVAFDRRARAWDGVVGRAPSLPQACQDQTSPTCWAHYPHAFARLGWTLFYIESVEKTEISGATEDGLRLTLPRSALAWKMKAAKKAGQPFTPIASFQDIFSPGDVIWIAQNEEAKAPDTLAPEDKTAPVKIPSAPTWAIQQVPKVNGAMMALDPHTGRVYAMVGGTSFDGSEFNRATQATRQPGSSFKPFVALAAMESGYAPNSRLLDAPVVMEILGADQDRIWKPSNYSGDFYGLTTIRRGIELSRNLMTVRLALAMGLKPIQDVAHRFGVYDKMPPYYSSVLGSNETTLLKMTQAYAELVNGGKKIHPSLVDRIQDRYGKTIFRHDDRACADCLNQTWQQQDPPILPDTRETLADPRQVYQVVSILSGVVARGTGAKIGAAFPGYALAGKTGTTNDSRDVWFMGFSPDLVVGVYFGYDQPQTLGRKETGGSVAVPVFIDFMKKILPTMPSVPFRMPAGIRLVSTDLNSGVVVPPDTPGSIVEAFIPGQDLEQKTVEVPGDSTGGDVPGGSLDTPDSLDGIY